MAYLGQKGSTLLSTNPSFHKSIHYMFHVQIVGKSSTIWNLGGPPLRIYPARKSISTIQIFNTILVSNCHIRSLPRAYTYINRETFELYNSYLALQVVESKVTQGQLMKEKEDCRRMSVESGSNLEVYIASLIR